jgi:hypothetical protein
LHKDRAVADPAGLSVLSSEALATVADIGRNGKHALSFAKVMRQVQARLTESRGNAKLVIVFCDLWDSDSFREEYFEELGAHARNGVQFLFLMVGVPDRVLVPVPVRFDHAPP